MSVHIIVQRIRVLKRNIALEDGDQLAELLHELIGWQCSELFRGEEFFISATHVLDQATPVVFVADLERKLNVGLPVPVDVLTDLFHMVGRFTRVVGELAKARVEPTVLLVVVNLIQHEDRSDFIVDIVSHIVKATTMITIQSQQKVMTGV